MKRFYETIGWLGAFLVIFGYYLNANESIQSWLIWIIGNICVTVYAVHKKTYPTALMSCVIAIMNIYGYFKWL